MKLLIITGIYPPTPGGPATYTKLLEDELPKKGFDVSVVTFDSVRHLPKGIRHIVFIFKILKAGKKVDLLYTQDPVSVGFPTYIASKILKKNYVLKVVGDYAWEQGRQRFGVTDLLDAFIAPENVYHRKVMALKKVQTTVAKAAAKIIVPSNYLQGVVSAWGIDQKKIEVVYNAFNGAYVKETKEVLREKHKLSSDTKVLVSVARLVPWKGLDTLISLIPKLLGTHKDIHLFIIGSGPEMAHLEEAIVKYDVSKYVTLTGSLESSVVYEYISLADVFVLNTAYEGLSHVLLESLALGTPVVTTNVGGNPELVQNKKNGLLVPYNDKDALLQAIGTILGKENEVEIASYVEAGKQIPEHFNREFMLKHVERVLRDTLQV